MVTAAPTEVQFSGAAHGTKIRATEKPLAFILCILRCRMVLQDCFHERKRQG